tara:strand:- start:44 stop:238 length:195 start_codon:yes stop_codon:yes gene_type:complete
MAKDQFGFGTNKPKKVDWISTTYKGKKYKFMNIPEVHEMMQGGSLFDMQDTFDTLMKQGYIKEA